ncbi:alpha/beta fold hydrolase [Pseudodonghicola flavimaris]|uniref:Maspardin n=1 Tax=Pseudodonghicola flavimaris TaxID=3050036 RepID=A0ABT7EXM1_9RHOB|nr:alpha/beta hydrolase [Pseudodonghicola flavimaris]MDK3017096.1 alpha/beta hydrolase [Pseudodonghicola flavimaris]
MSNSLIAARDAFAARCPEQRLAVNGRDWGYVEMGAGPVLLLIPGTLGRGDIFWQQIEALSDRLRVVAVTYPATGSIAEWAEDLAALMDLLRISSASVLGSSLGGYLAQYLAATAPHRVRRLLAANTLCSAAGIAERPPYALDLDIAPIDGLRAGFGQGLGAWGAAHPDQTDLVELLLQEVGGRIPEPELRMRLKALKTAPELPELPLPAECRITIEAADDPLIPPEMRAAVRARLTPAVAYRFAWGGHFPYVVRPDAYIALIEQAMGLAGTGPDWGAGEERVL